MLSQPQVLSPIAQNPDQVNLVDSSGQIIGAMDKMEAHRGKGKKHQAISLFIFRVWPDKKIELLLQQRSLQKIVGANQWANSLCANVRPGESHRDCLERRLLEELGIGEKHYSQEAQPLFDFSYEVACENDFSENELDRFFIVICDVGQEPALTPNSAEVRTTAWENWSLEKPKKIEQNREFTPWFKLFLSSKMIGEKMDRHLNEYLTTKETV